MLGIVCPPGILNRNWSITNHILQVFSLRLDPQSPLAARWNRRLSNLTGQLSGKAHDSQVLLRQIHCELLRRSDLIIAGYLIWGNGQAKVFGEETVSLFAVLELVIMSARIAVLVPSQIVLFAKQTEEGPNPTIDIRLHQSGTKAAVILCVMNEQGGTGCAGEIRRRDRGVHHSRHHRRLRSPATNSLIPLKVAGRRDRIGALPLKLH